MLLSVNAKQLLHLEFEDVRIGDECWAITRHVKIRDFGSVISDFKEKTAVYMSSRHYHNKWGLLMTKSCNDTRHTVEETSEKKSNTMETRVLNIYQEENKYVCRKESGIVLTADPSASSPTHPMDSKKIPCISRSALRVEARQISDERTLWAVRQLEAGPK